MGASARSFDIIDLDPCGSPSPFLESAVRAIKDGGLLCIASTEDPSLDLDLCRSKYGGVCLPKYPPAVVKTAGFAVAAEIHIRLLLSRIHSVASKGEGKGGG